ncbi:hypothetical protein Sste5346_005851 [Sporothrix stenoceras]|uniref:Uncharacterized protein n=1 Tax=Sporothrix stenoceras TaxID=5173 RepID=A0ABR3Z2E2_9PEZI
MARLSSLFALTLFGTASLASVCRQSGTAPACGLNLVNEPMFAGGGGPPEESGWTITGGEAYVPNQCSSTTITSCLVFYQAATLVQTVPTTPGSLYAFSFSLLSAENTSPLVTCGPTNADGDYISGEEATATIAATNVWKDFTSSFVATDTETEFKCR